MVVGVTRCVHLGYIHNTMAKYKLPHCMAVFPLHIEPTAYDHHYVQQQICLAVVISQAGGWSKW